MQVAHHRDHHDPPRLIRALAVAAALALALAGSAAGARLTTLPSPAAPLSAAPPLAGGAASSAEGIRHRVDAETSVHVSVDRSGTPFAVVATQRLHVRIVGDYFFLIGAPVTAIAAAPGSESQPGFRTGSIVWAGFDPGRRLLAARATLASRQAAPFLPLQIHARGSRTVLVNATRITVSAYAADAVRAPLLAYLDRLRAASRSGTLPVGTAAEVTSTPVPVRLAVAAPLRVSGTIGGRRVALLLHDRAVVPAAGAVDLRVEPDAAVNVTGAAALDGRALLAAVTRTVLTLARTRQYDAFLGNPDPTGRSETTYTYRTGARPVAAPSLSPVTHGRSWTATLLVAAGVVAALAAGAAVWARS